MSYESMKMLEGLTKNCQSVMVKHSMRIVDSQLITHNSQLEQKTEFFVQFVAR